MTLNERTGEVLFLISWACLYHGYAIDAAKEGEIIFLFGDEIDLKLIDRMKKNK